MKYINPKLNQQVFTCPHCETTSKVDWHHFIRNKVTSMEDAHFHLSRCQHCQKYTFWIEDKKFYPVSITAPKANEDMPESVLRLYNEAALIQDNSPRGAAALLRLSIQHLMKEVGEEGKNINADIKNLVKNGLNPIVQKSLDAVRVTGNDAVHPGQIDTDNPETVQKLFELVNIIVDYMISMPKKVNNIYDSIPDAKKEGIENRDR